MAKYCGYCGTKLEDNAKICGHCGTSVDGISTNIPSLKMVNPEKQKKMKEMSKWIVATASLVVIAVIAFNIVSQYTGYNGLLRKVMTAYKEYDIDTLIFLSSDMYFYGEDDWVEYYFECNVGDDLDSFESSVGHSYKLSYKVNEIYTVSDRKLDNMLDQIEYNYVDFDINVIKKIVIADLTVTAKQESKSVSTDMNIVMSKENDSWRLLYIE